MQAVKAYYDEGKFVPLQPIQIPKGSQAIVTILDLPIIDNELSESENVISDEAYSDWRKRLKEAIALSMDEDLPDLPPREPMRPPVNFED